MDEWSKPTIVSGCFMYSSSEKKLEILNDHYKDTFSHLVGYRKQRDRLLLYLLALVVIMWLYDLFPEEMSNTVSEIISEKTGVTKVESIISNVLKELPMLCAVFLAFRYWQTWHLIESQYDYLEKLETELASLFSSGIPFTRESNFSYKKNRNLSIWSHKPYNLSFTLLFYGLFLLRLTSDYRLHGFSWGWLISCIIWIILFLFWHFRIMRSKTY